MEFSFYTLLAIAPMAGVLSSVCPIQSSNAAGVLLSGSIRVGWTDQFPPFFYGIRSYQLHSQSIVGSHELKEPVVKGLALMLGIKLFGILVPHLEHFEVGDVEVLLDDGDDLADVEVDVRLQHSVCFV